MKSKTVLIVINFDVGLYTTRKELIESLISTGYRVVISCPTGTKTEELIKLGCEHIDIDMNRHGTNPISELRLFYNYFKLIEEVKPDIILGYTIKPNIYSGIVSRIRNIPFIPNITGLGMVFQKNSISRKIAINLYKIALKNADVIFFQNDHNQAFFLENSIIRSDYQRLPGSGVNLKHFKPLEYPSDEIINFVFISRVMKDKGIEEFLEAAEYIKNRYSNVNFHICGILDGNYKGEIKEYEEKNVIHYHGLIDDVRNVLNKSHCTILPSYHEGMSNVLLESAASGRPVLASQIPGCKETFEEGVSGIGFEPKNTSALIGAIEKFLKLSHAEKERMGIKGRQKVEQEFDRMIVVDKYLKEIKLAVEGKKC